MIVCSPNLLHARVVRAALEAGKHVAVEFPLAASAAEARDLLGLARRVGRVLHVEHIELLSSSQRVLREWARDLGRPRAGGVRFTGALEGWLADPASAGSPALCAVARLHRLVDLFGPARVGAARVEPLSGGWRLEVELGFERGGVASLVEERAHDLGRTSTWRVDCERGVLETPPAAPAGALFREDLDCFIARVETGAASYVSDERVLHVLGLVDAIDAILA